MTSGKGRTVDCPRSETTSKAVWKLRVDTGVCQTRGHRIGTDSSFRIGAPSSISAAKLPSGETVTFRNLPSAISDNSFVSTSTITKRPDGRGFKDGTVSILLNEGSRPASVRFQAAEILLISLVPSPIANSTKRT